MSVKLYEMLEPSNVKSGPKYNFLKEKNHVKVDWMSLFLTENQNSQLVAP